ncbi:RNA-binding protein 45-like [Drosophila willistoni]|uniref:RNA-binding protein 45-like n=1 Tax=Drosophila willistoni TaxID=7260 RepID=UPI001F078B0C|nr:RNA-binding protein 45-like [Drosophila willistoni]
MQNLPHSFFKNIFSCWKGLIDVYLLPNKHCGYVKYSAAESARRAIHVLNGAEICGTKIKVMEAEERCGSDGEITAKITNKSKLH